MSMNGVANTENAAASVSPAAIQIVRDSIVQQTTKPAANLDSAALAPAPAPANLPVSVATQETTKAEALKRFQLLANYNKQKTWRTQRQNLRAVLFGVGGFVSGLILWGIIKHELGRFNHPSGGTGGGNVSGGGAKRFRNSRPRLRSRTWTRRPSRLGRS